MGMTTVSERFCIMENTPPFQPCGVCPTCPATSATWLLTESKMPVYCPVIASIRPSLIQSVIQSNPPILTFVMCYELIQLVTEKNNLHDDVC